MSLMIITELPAVPETWWDRVLSLYGPMWLILVGGAFFVTAMAWKLGTPILNWIIESTSFYRAMKETVPDAITGMKEWSGGTSHLLDEIRDDVKDVKRAVQKS